MKVIKVETLDMTFPEKYNGNIVHGNDGSVFVSDAGLIVPVPLNIVHQAEILVGNLDALLNTLVEELIKNEPTTESS